jgi:hypothetical protein
MNPANIFFCLHHENKTHSIYPMAIRVMLRALSHTIVHMHLDCMVGAAHSSGAYFDFVILIILPLLTYNYVFRLL